MFALLISSIFAGFAGPARLVLLTVMLSAGVGLVEDLRGVPVLRRLTFQFVAVTPLLFATSAQTRLPTVLWAVFAVLYLVSVMNAVNFMDGVNGITSAQGVVAGVAFAALAAHYNESDLAVFAAATAAVCAAFAPFNVPTARVFLGDTGSYGVGAALGALSLSLWAAGAPWEASVGPLTLYLADTGTTLIRRKLAGNSLHLPHRTHVYQRLTDVGWSHTRVSALIFALTSCSAALGAVSLVGGSARALADLVLGILIATYLSLPRLLARRLLQRAALRIPATP